MQLTFNSSAGDESYDIERAEGAAGAFAQVTNVAAPAAPGQVTYVDASLKVNTLYRYHVITNKGGLKSTRVRGSYCHYARIRQCGDRCHDRHHRK